MTDKEIIRKEIERRWDEYLSHKHTEKDPMKVADAAVSYELMQILRFIDRMPSDTIKATSL